MQVIWRGFRGVARFSGRDRPGQFWPFAGVVIALMFLVQGMLTIGPMANLFGEVARYAREHPDEVTVQQGPGHYAMRIEGSDAALEAMLTTVMGDIVRGGIVAVAIVIVLLSAAVTRRLHDSGRAGWWGLAPLPFLAFSMSLFPKLLAGMADDQPDLSLFAAVFLSNMLYLATTGGLVLLLVLKGTPGENRYGPPASER